MTNTITCAMKREAWTGIYQVIWYLQKSFVRGVNHVLIRPGILNFLFLHTPVRTSGSVNLVNKSLLACVSQDIYLLGFSGWTLRMLHVLFNFV